MISRRNIRVKVMQTLYSLASLPAAETEEKELQIGNKLLNEKLSHSLDLFTTVILYVARVAQYAETDAAARASKFLPTEADLAVNTRIAGNEALWQILGNKSFTERVKESALERYIDGDWVKKLYQQLSKSETYVSYTEAAEKSAKSERAILQHIWETLMLGNDAVMEHFTDELPGWEDDKDMIVMLMQNFFRNPAKINFLDLLSGEKKEYAKELLRNVLQREDYTMEFIRPRLVGWEAERVALIDMLLLRMGVCEFLYFPTIPTRVTINEYIEIAKQYSTPQSGQFVNGMLDNILKSMEKEGMIRKTDRPAKS